MFDHVQRYVNALMSRDVYDEPKSDHHDRNAREAVIEFCKDLPLNSAVELGCGAAPALDALREIGVEETLGVTLGHEAPSHKVLRKDMHFTQLKNDSYDIVVARHALEHSYMPLIMLMEMHRISKQYALVVVPQPTQLMIEWKNHYSVLTDPMWRQLFKLAGWEVVKYDEATVFRRLGEEDDVEYRYLLKIREDSDETVYNGSKRRNR